MDLIVSIWRDDPWALAGVLTALVSVASTMTSKSGALKRLFAVAIAVVISFAIVGGMGRLVNRVEADARKTFSNEGLEGMFSATGGKLGTWSQTPSRCLDGKERGFEGMLFVFDQGPVKEIRVDTQRRGNNSIAVHLDDDSETVVRVRERECKVFDGRIHASNLQLNGRDMRKLHGNLKVSCPGAALEAAVSFNGCLPETL